MNDLKMYSKYLIVDGKKVSTTELTEMFSKIDNFSISENGSYHNIIISIKTNYIMVYVEFGNPIPRPDHIINIHTNTNEVNPRTANQIEPKQMFIVIDGETSRLWISNIRKTVVAELIFRYIKKTVEIKNIYTSEEFIEKLNSVNGIKLSSSPLNILKLDDLNSILDDDVYGYGATSATLELKYEKSRLLEGNIANRIKNLFTNRSGFESFIISGKDDGGMDVVFNNESLVQKIFLDIKPNEYGEYDKEDVLKKFLRG